MSCFESYVNFYVGGLGKISGLLDKNALVWYNYFQDHKDLKDISDIRI